jgi:hypothetical protein
MASTNIHALTLPMLVSPAAYAAKMDELDTPVFPAPVSSIPAIR